jgi:hypothetical protein
MGVSEDLKNKLVKVSIDKNGHLDFHCPNGTQIPALIEAKVDWKFNEYGLITVNMTVHGYFESNKS